MQFGMPTLIELKSTESCAALCRELGLSFVELNMNLPEYQADKLDANHLQEISDEYNIYYTFHVDENLNPFDFNKWVAKAYTDTMIAAIVNIRSKRLSVPVLNMHLNSGVWFTLPDKKAYLFEEYRDEYMQKLTAFRDVCTKAITGTDIKISVENTSSFQLDFVAEGIATLLESPVFALTFDTGHNAGSGFRQQSLIERHIDRFSHMHLHDYSKARGDHLPLGEGELNLQKYLDLAKDHDCRVVLEVKTIEGLRQSVNWLKARGYL